MKKTLTLLSIFLILSIIATGCQPQAVETQETEEPVVTEPDKPKDIVISMAASPKLLDPVKYSSTYESYVIYNVFNTLVNYSSDLQEIVPCLGELTEVTDDGLWYNFKIRDDVHFQPGKFQDGRLMTAEDVKYSLERSKNESAMERLNMLDHCDVISDTEIKCALSEPDATFLTFLTDAGNSIVPKEEVEGQGEAFSQNPIGTGPYQLTKFVADQEIVLKKNENYWAQTPALDTVTFKVIQDSTQSANALVTGEIHIALNLGGEGIQIVRDAAADGVKLMETPQLGFNYLSFNVANGITADKKVRQALSMAINVDELIQGMFPFGNGTRNYLPVPTGSWGYDESLLQYVPKYDPEAARELLKGTEYENGFEVNFYHSATEARIKMATILQAQLKENLNVTLIPHQSDFASFTEVTRACNAEMGTVSWSWFPDPYFYLNSFFHSRATGTLGGGSCLQNPAIDEILDKAAKKGTIEERKALYGEAIKLILDEYTGLYFASENVTWGVSDSVQGLVQRADGILILSVPGVNVDLK